MYCCDVILCPFKFWTLFTSNVRIYYINEDLCFISILEYWKSVSCGLLFWNINLWSIGSVASGRFIYFLLSPLVQYHHRTNHQSPPPRSYGDIFLILFCGYYIIQNQMTKQALLFLGVNLRFLSIVYWPIYIKSFLADIHTLLKMFYVKNIHYKLYTLYRCYKCWNARE